MSDWVSVAEGLGGIATVATAAIAILRRLSLHTKTLSQLLPNGGTSVADRLNKGLAAIEDIRQQMATDGAKKRERLDNIQMHLNRQDDDSAGLSRRLDGVDRRLGGIDDRCKALEEKVR